MCYRRRRSSAASSEGAVGAGRTRRDEYYVSRDDTPDRRAHNSIGRVRCRSTGAARRDGRIQPFDARWSAPAAVAPAARRARHTGRLPAAAALRPRQPGRLLSRRLLPRALLCALLLSVLLLSVLRQPLCLRSVLHGSVGLLWIRLRLGGGLVEARQRAAPRRSQ